MTSPAVLGRMRDEMTKEEIRQIDEETLEKIGKAFVIFAQFPEVFGDVPLWKLKGLFLDGITEKD